MWRCLPALLLHLVSERRLRRRWTRNYATGFADAIEAARSAAPVARRRRRDRRCAVDDLARFYHWFAATERTVTLYSQGVNQSSAGTDKVNAIINCHLATGRIGRPGMGPLSLTGQPNAMGGREVGGLANQLAAHMGFADAGGYRPRAPLLECAAHRDAAGPQGGRSVRRGARRQGQGAVDPRHQPGREHAARRARVAHALAACPFVVVSDCWPTDTTRFADVVLPAAGWGEKDGTVTNSERCISRQRAFRPPPGEARPDWWMLTEVARRMGWRDGVCLSQPGRHLPRARRPSAFENGEPHRRIFDIGALRDLSDEEYDRLPPVRWPLPRGTAEPGRRQAAVWRWQTVSDRGRPRAFRADAVPAAGGAGR